MKTERNFDELEVKVRATIRACREDDLPALEWMGLYSRHRGIIRETFEAQQRGDALMLLGVTAGFPIAQVWISFKRHSSLATLWAVRTFHPLQGAGIGKRMMRAAERAIARRGIARAELEVDDDNQEVLGFYRQLGWQVVRRPEERSGKSDRFLLAKEITAH
ncbi:MAG TPA: GNAT family N-acetyltransferase [Pararhizobium sp.]|nr:GNAT family N-acetyltransferase [Pararhizobium sp.]